MRERDIRLVVTVPDAGLSALLDLCHADERIQVVTLSSEEEGVGMLCGAWLGARRAVLCMQSSGVGNCVNALALPGFTQTGCLMLVTMRGQQGEGNRAQIPMGSAAKTVLEAMGVRCREANRAGDVGPLFASAADAAFERDEAAAVLVAQAVIGVKSFAK